MKRPVPKHSILSLEAAERLVEGVDKSIQGNAETRFTPRGVPYTAGLRLCSNGSSYNTCVGFHVPNFTGGAVVELRSDKEWDHLRPFRIRGTKRLKAGWDADAVSRALLRLYRELDAEIRLADRRELVYHLVDALPRSRQRELDRLMEEAGHTTLFAGMDAAALDWIEARLGLPPQGA